MEIIFISVFLAVLYYLGVWKLFAVPFLLLLTAFIISEKREKRRQEKIAMSDADKAQPCKEDDSEDPSIDNAA